METNKRETPIRMSEVDPQAQAIMEVAKNNLLLVLVAHLGGRVSIPVKTLDDYPIGRGMELQHRGDRLVLQLIEGPNTRTGSLDGVK